MAGRSISLTLAAVLKPLHLTVGGQRQLSRKSGHSLKTDSQDYDPAPGIYGAVKEAEFLLDLFLLLPPLRYFTLCPLILPIPQEVGYLGENRTEVLERQKKREHYNFIFRVYLFIWYWELNSKPAMVKHVILHGSILPGLEI